MGIELSGVVMNVEIHCNFSFPGPYKNQTERYGKMPGTEPMRRRALVVNMAAYGIGILEHAALSPIPTGTHASATGFASHTQEGTADTLERMIANLGVETLSGSSFVA